MSSESSDTRWLHLLKAGDRDAATILWERYFRLLLSCARQRLGGGPRAAADEEDVALSAFASFCRGVEKGRFPRMDDRDDLRNVLLLLVARKAAHHLRDERCGKRGGGKVSALSELPGDSSANKERMGRFIDAEPTPELAALFADECGRLLDKLGDEELRAIALWLVEGDTVEEIAQKCGRSPRTVARKLAQIRDVWSEEWSSA
jgi:RNA polymerase sigma factor (sigma-70 family)